MLFAYLHPSFEAALQRIDKMSSGVKLFIRSLLVAGQSWRAAERLQACCCLQPHSHAYVWHRPLHRIAHRVLLAWDFVYAWGVVYGVGALDVLTISHHVMWDLLLAQGNGGSIDVICHAMLCSHLQ